MQKIKNKTKCSYSSFKYLLIKLNDTVEKVAIQLN